MSTLQTKPSRLPAVRKEQLACVVIVIVSGTLVLLGWFSDIEILKRIFPTLVAMNPVTAVGFILLSVSLFFSQSESVGRQTRLIAQICAGSIAIVGLIKLSEIVFGWTSGVDQLLFAAKLAADATGQPNRMAPNTALNFLLLGSALLLLDKKIRRGLHVSDVLILISIFDSLLPIIGYLYGTKLFYGVGNFIPMALHTALLFLILGIGILLARPGRGINVTILDRGISGVMMRRFLPVVIGLPILIGWLRLEGQGRNFYDNELGVALMVVSQMVFLTGFVWWHSFLVLRIDTKRKNVEVLLHEMTLTDELTGLRNRRGFFLLAEQELKVALNKQMGVILWCIYADLDGLKKINDSLGHEFGSEAIVRTADILKATFRDADILARLGGDEFAVLAVSNSLAGGSLLLERLNRKVHDLNEQEQLLYKLALSVGLVRFDPDKKTSVNELLKEADQAMYEDKNSKKDRDESTMQDLKRTAKYRNEPHKPVE